MQRKKSSVPAHRQEEETTYGCYEVRRGLLPRKRYMAENEAVAVSLYIRDFRLANNLDKSLFSVERIDNKESDVEEVE
jgi:hypothetical protein